MACKLKVHGKLPFIWNISDKVGDTKSVANRSTDVELVNVLLDFIEKRRKGDSPVAQSGLTINGTFDVWTAYNIYNIQATRKIDLGLAGAVIDGIVSPARSDDPMKWTIVYLNHVMHNVDKNVFMQLDSDMRLSPQLRAELSGMRIG